MIELDAIDTKLLRALARDATQSAGALGRRLGLSQPATWRRIRRLEQAGVIRGRQLRLDAEKLGFGVTVFLGVKLALRGRVSLEDFERVLRRRIMTLPGAGEVEANVLLSEERLAGPL